MIFTNQDREGAPAVLMNFDQNNRRYLRQPILATAFLRSYYLQQYGIACNSKNIRNNPPSRFFTPSPPASTTTPAHSHPPARPTPNVGKQSASQYALSVYAQ